MSLRGSGLTQVAKQKITQSYRGSFNLGEKGKINKVFLSQKVLTEDGLQELKDTFAKFEEANGLTDPKYKDYKLSEVITLGDDNKKLADSLQEVIQDTNNQEKRYYFMKDLGFTDKRIQQQVDASDVQEMPMSSDDKPKPKPKPKKAEEEEEEEKSGEKELEPDAIPEPAPAPTPAPAEPKVEPPIQDIEEVPKALPRPKATKSKAKVELKIEPAPAPAPPTVPMPGEPAEKPDEPKPKLRGKRKAGVEPDDPVVEPSIETGMPREPVEPTAEPKIELTTTKPKSAIVEKEVKTGLEDIPSKIDLIPKERLSSEFKSAKELEDDISYFFKTFPKQLAKIKKAYDKAKKTPQYLKRTHKRIVALLSAGAKQSKEKIGVIVSGSEFIKDKLREIYLEEINKGLTAEDLLVQIEGDKKDKDKNDIGSYQVVKGPQGKEHAERQPIARYIPEGEEQDPRMLAKAKPKRLPDIQTKYNSRYTYENNLYQNNPFRKQQPTIHLRKLY